MTTRHKNAKAVAKIAARTVLGATIFVLIGRALAPHWTEIANAASNLRPGYIVASAAAYFIYTFLNAGVWGQVLTAIGHPLSPTRSARIWVMTEALRWLPGGIWGYCSRVLEAHRHGVPKTIASLSLTVEIALTVAAWCTAAAAGTLLSPLLGQLLAAVPINGLLPVGLLLIVFAVGATIALRVTPNSYLSRLATGAVWKLRAHGGIRLRHKSLFVAFGAYLLLCFVQGVALLLIVRSLGIDAPPSLFLLTAVNAVAWLSGFFAIGVPAGIGVREVALVAGLALSIPLEAAVCAAGIWRAVQIAVEPLCLGSCVITSAINRRHRVPEAPAASIR